MPQLNPQQQHLVNDPANDINFFYNMIQQQQNVAAPSQKLIARKVLKKPRIETDIRQKRHRYARIKTGNFLSNIAMLQ